MGFEYHKSNPWGAHELYKHLQQFGLKTSIYFAIIESSNILLHKTEQVSNDLCIPSEFINGEGLKKTKDIFYVMPKKTNKQSNWLAPDYFRLSLYKV